MVFLGVQTVMKVLSTHNFGRPLLCEFERVWPRSVSLYPQTHKAPLKGAGLCERARMRWVMGWDAWSLAYTNGNPDCGEIRLSKFTPAYQPTYKALVSQDPLYQDKHLIYPSQFTPFMTSIPSSSTYTILYRCFNTPGYINGKTIFYIRMTKVKRSWSKNDLFESLEIWF